MILLSRPNLVPNNSVVCSELFTTPTLALHPGTCTAACPMIVKIARIARKLMVVGLAGVTHVDRNLKTAVTAKLNIPFNVDLVKFDVNIVVANNRNEGSISCFTQYTLKVSGGDSAPTEAPAGTISCGLLGRGLFCPFVSFLDRRIVNRCPVRRLSSLSPYENNFCVHVSGGLTLPVMIHSLEEEIEFGKKTWSTPHTRM
jgi:hypothetical protein